MAVTAYFDESKRGSLYRLSSVLVPHGDCARVRRELDQVRGRSRSIHMSTSNSAQRMTYTKTLAALGLQSVTVSTRGGKARQMRNQVLRHMVLQMKTEKVTRILIESCDQDAEDRRLLHAALGPDSAISYDLLGKADDILLGLPDIHAWGWGYGSAAYRDLLKPSTTDLGDIGGYTPPGQTRGTSKTRKPRSTTGAS